MEKQPKTPRKASRGGFQRAVHPKESSKEFQLPVDSRGGFQHPSKVKSSPPPPPDDVESEDDKCLICDEKLDDDELYDEIDQTQRLEDEPLGGEEEDDSSDDEGDFRSHAKDMITRHGLANVQAWFQVECRKCKKPKLKKDSS